METYLAWIGQNATSGSPNSVTGRMSMHGDLHAFSTKENRDEFCDTYNHLCNRYPIAVSRNSARKYHLGMSVRDYNEHIDQLDIDW